MKKYYVFILSLLAFTASSQDRKQVMRINADSVHLSNPAGTNELILENRSRVVQGGYLFNKQQGITEFRKMELKQIGVDRIAVVGQDTAVVPRAQKLYILPNDVCQDWNGSNIIVMRGTSRVWLNLATPDGMVDGKEIIVSTVAAQDYEAGINGYLTIYIPDSSDVRILHEGTGKQALDVSGGTALRLIYVASLNNFVVVTQNGRVNSTTGPCPYR